MLPKNRAQTARAIRLVDAGAFVALTACLAGCGGEDDPSRRTAEVPAVPHGLGGMAAASPQAGTSGAGPMATAPWSGTAGQGDPETPPGGAAASGTSGGAAGMPAGAAGMGAGTVGAAGAGGGAGTMGTAGTAGTGGSDAGMMGAAGTGGSASTGDICARWTADRANLSEGTWNGDVATCEAGDMTGEARENALRLVNLYRSMVGLESLEMTEEGNRLAQGCALLMKANGRISHGPTASWACYTMEAADTAGASSLSSGPAVASVDGYMVDPGNPTTLGHRRWILSNWLTTIGFGSADRFSCQYQPASFRRGDGGAPWVAWPPPGQVPIQAFGTRFSTIDRTGWSVQSDSIDLGNAQVTVTAGGTELAVSVTELASGYGSTYALGFIPMGWTTEAGKTYSVRIDGISTPIEYDVEVVDCQ